MEKKSPDSQRSPESEIDKSKLGAAVAQAFEQALEQARDERGMTKEQAENILVAITDESHPHHGDTYDELIELFLSRAGALSATAKNGKQQRSVKPGVETDKPGDPFGF